MADDKKPEAKPAEAPAPLSHPDPFVEIVWIILAILIALYLLNGFIAMFTGGAVFSSNGFGFRLLAFVKSWFWLIFAYFKFIAVLLSIALILWIVNLHKKVTALRKAEAALMYIEKEIKPEESTNPEWDRVLKHAESLNENDWRLAIIEADIILGNLLDKIGLVGDSIGEKLKMVEKGDFKNIDSAWEAHKIRNQIAHEGGGFIINQHETKRVIGLYKSVFEEFKLI